MTHTRRRFNLKIWGLAFGYFCFYAPYSALVKATTTGLLPGLNAPVTGFHLLPPVIVGTVASMLACTSLLGWWKYAGRRRLFGVNLIWPSPLVLLSGFGTAVVIATTTLAYTFHGVSIVLALLLLRGGVLMLAPTIDFIFRRRVRWFSWCALGLSLTAVLVVLADVDNYSMSLLAWLNVAAYLSGYTLRLPCMNRMGKSEERSVRLRYLVEEQAVAAFFLLTIPVALALWGGGSAMSELGRGFAALPASGLAAPGLLIGTLYACLYFFGTLIYLDSRENSFCVPLNRASSLLAGIFAAQTLAVLYAQRAPSAAELFGSVLIVAALMLLSPLHHGHRVAARVRRSLGVAYRAFADDFAKQGAVAVSIAQAATPSSDASIDERLAKEERVAES